MATPTTYPLDYDDPCNEELGCDLYCVDKIRFVGRPRVFCEDVTLQMNLEVMGNTVIDGTLTVNTPAVIVAGRTYVPSIIAGLNGAFYVLAAAGAPSPLPPIPEPEPEV